VPTKQNPTLPQVGSNNQNKIDIHNLQNGIYTLQIITDKGILYKKIIKN
jgi:hypothetical protein